MSNVSTVLELDSGLSESVTTLFVDFCDTMEELDSEFADGVNIGKLPNYTGPYTVIPKVKQDQTLNTKDKSMVDDVVVLEIPYEEVHNVTGTTFTIGGK